MDSKIVVFTICVTAALSLLFAAQNGSARPAADVGFEARTPASGSVPAEAPRPREEPTKAVQPSRSPADAISAEAYLVADTDSGRTLASKSAGRRLPVASITKLITALVALESIGHGCTAEIEAGKLPYPEVATSTGTELVGCGDLLRPLLMESNNHAADALAGELGASDFVARMNAKARSIGMKDTSFADPSGISPANLSTANDLAKLAAHIASERPEIFAMTKQASYELTAESGTAYKFRNFNVFFADPAFVGGKVGQTRAAGRTMLAVFNVRSGTGSKNITIVVLRSRDYAMDTSALRRLYAGR